VTDAVPVPAYGVPPVLPNTVTTAADAGPAKDAGKK
jgi:hypothetical protein